MTRVSVKICLQLCLPCWSSLPSEFCKWARCYWHINTRKFWRFWNNCIKPVELVKPSLESPRFTKTVMNCLGLVTWPDISFTVFVPGSVVQWWKTSTSIWLSCSESLSRLSSLWLQSTKSKSEYTWEWAGIIRHDLRGVWIYVRLGSDPHVECQALSTRLEIF